MDYLSLGIFETLKLATQLVSHKLLQRSLATNETHELSTNFGKIRGLKRRVVYELDEYYYAFEGIPFAKPPLGELRFRAPQPPESWGEEVLDCTKCRDKPIQKNGVTGIIEGSEDCLYLNVYVKNLISDKPLPVMVWTYGGAFRNGEASRDIYAPDYFMKQNIILVSITYRLGPLGFLSLSDPDLGVPGNAGLKDQLLALQWIKQNISNFNGDANNITLFGESAGAASTQFMMLIPKAKGLFHKAILQSGSVLCPWSNNPPRDWAYRFATELGYQGSKNDKEIFRFLANVDAKKLYPDDAKIITKEEKIEGLLFTFVPVVEPYESEDCVISKPYKELLKTAWSNEIPIVLGANSFEGLFFYPYSKQNPYLLDDLEDCEILLPREIIPHHTAEELREMGLKLKEAYFGCQKPSIEKTLFPYLDLMSYKHLWHGIHRTVLARLAYAPQTPTYLYRFDFDSPFFNMYRILLCGRNIRGVAHADDVFYLFYTLMSSKLPKESKELKTIERLIGIWTTFAATSNPNCTQIAPTIWEPVQTTTAATPSTIKCLNISEKVEFIDLPEKQKLEIWDSFYTKEELY